METGDNTTKTRTKFGLSAVLVIGALFGILGFGLGTNFDSLDLGRFQTVNPNLPENLDFAGVEEIYDVLRTKYAGELTEEELLTGSKKGLTEAAGDPFTEYLDAAAARELQESLDGEFGGIGAEIGVRNGQLVIVAPLEGTPAERAGLRPRDVILAIDGNDTASLSLQEAVSRIRGKEGTEVVLTISRDSRSTEDLTITRANIEVPSVNTEMMENGVGYIELVQFGNDTARDFRRAAADLRSRGAKSIILDVRNNPGGYLDIAVAITSEFLEAGQVVVEERRNEEVIATERAQNGGSLVGLPVIVLINEGSASASEIIAGALRDNNVARLIGKQTFGKGSVQELVRLRSGGMLRVTIANWYTPGGLNINKEGISPDETVELTEEDVDNERDPQLEKAIQLLRN